MSFLTFSKSNITVPYVYKVYGFYGNIWDLSGNCV